MKKRETKLLFLFATAWCAAFLAYFGTGSQYPCFGPSVAELETTQLLPESSTDGGSFGSATSGKLFSGNVIRRFDVAKKLGPLSSSNSGALKKSLTFPGPKCRYWSVTTTIFEPSEAMQIQANLGDEWCIVIAGDRKGSNKYDLRRSSDNSDSRIVYLSAKKQEELEENNFEFIRQLPWNHFGRKNIGYLYAIANEAEYIWDFDDDNALIDKNSKHIVTPCNDESKDHVTLSVLPPSLNNCRSYNPYPAMGAPILPCWPRGLPLDDIKSEPCVLASNASLLSTKSVPRSSLAVCQSLAQHDPDVDAIYRLTQPLPINFLQDVSSPTSVMVPRHALTPFNAQATMFSRDSHWMLLLPITVHGRVSDIWRSYAGQRLLKEIGLEVVFTPALVVQDRNAHNYLADFDSEGPLYLKSGKLVEFLLDWEVKNSSGSFVETIEQLYIDLYERSYIEVKDVMLLQSWIKSLVQVGYDFTHLDSLTNRNSERRAEMNIKHGRLGANNPKLN